MKPRAELLDLSPSSVCCRVRAAPKLDLALMRQIDELHLGARELAAQLRPEGNDVGRGHVRTLMWPTGTEALYPEPLTSIPS